MYGKNKPPPRKDVRTVRFPKLPDSILVECLVEKGGLPRRIALEWMQSPQMVVSAQMFWLDVGDAEKGDREARERVDYCREQWEFMKGAEKALGNDPEVQIAPFKLAGGQEVVIEDNVVTRR
jgi:hypothetical protein